MRSYCKRGPHQFMLNLRDRRKKCVADPLVTCGENAQEFLAMSGMHGLRYVGDSTLTMFERCFFTAAIATMIGMAGFFISNVYHKWTESPIFITMNSDLTSISEIPFPAVTICNMNLARKSVAKHIAKGSKEQHMLRSLCNYKIEENVVEFNDTNWEMFRELILKISQPCSHILVACQFAQNYEVCMNIFETVLTDEGLCCTFNSAHTNYTLQHVEYSDDFDGLNHTNRAIGWTPETGFTDPERKNTYPRRAIGPGRQLGLSLMINAQTYDYYCTSSQSLGFRVLLHLPTEKPKISNFGFTITPGIEASVLVTPSVSKGSNNIRRLPPEQRQCVFENESKLKYFKVYSRQNCEMECESRLLQIACGCVLYYMPRFGENPHICNRADMSCYNDVLYSIEMVTNETYRCDCLPGCYDVTYTPSLTTSDILPGMIYVEYGRYDSLPEYTKENMAIMHVFYSDKFFRINSKSVLVGFTDIISNIGGLLGLFMGFSILSLFEIAYFMTLRIYCKWHLRYSGRHHLPLVYKPFGDRNNVNRRFMYLKHIMLRRIMNHLKVDGYNHYK